MPADVDRVKRSIAAPSIRVKTKAVFQRTDKRHDGTPDGTKDRPTYSVAVYRLGIRKVR